MYAFSDQKDTRSQFPIGPIVLSLVPGWVTLHYVFSVIHMKNVYIHICASKSIGGR